jgi:hypothetical protein
MNCSHWKVAAKKILIILSWHLKQKYSDEEIESVISFFRNRGLKCDCDVIHKINLRDMSEKKINFHEEDLK